MAFILYFAVILGFGASMVVSRECDIMFDSNDCVYNVHCFDGVQYLYQEIYNRDYDRSNCSVNVIYSRYNVPPIDISLRGSFMTHLTDQIPILDVGDLYKLIIALNVSKNGYDSMPTLKQMDNLKRLDISSNLLETAKLSNEFELESLNAINLSHNIISDIKISNEEYPYQNLKIIDLSYNYLTTIPDAVFDAFGQLESLDVSHNYIEILRDLTFEGVKKLLHLNISHNRITSVDSSLFRFNKLLTLDFNGNKLQDVKRTDFEKLTSLQSLDLSSNLISSVETNAFDHMSFLTNLNFSNNQLKTIAKQTFLNAISLKEINLSENQFKELPRGMFKGKSISSFSIQGNVLTGSLLRGTFEGLQFVTQLDLGNQQLTSIEDYAFFGLEGVNKLLLNNNNIRVLSKNCFKSLQHLYEIDLSHNKISNIDFNKEDLVGLQALFLRNNQITQIKNENLHNLNSLQFLDVSNNNISHLDIDSFKSLKELINFEISNNPLSGVLEENTFEGLSSLPSLDISRSKMTAICNNSFMSMAQLRNLNISHSKISDLHFNAFRKTGVIQNIDLSFNQLTIFNINTTELSNLRTLLLDGNSLITVAKDTFQGLISLIKITLSNNNILNIDGDAFMDQKALGYLDLSYNPHLNFNISIIRKNNNLNSLYMLGITSVTNFSQASSIPISTLDISYAKIKRPQVLKLQQLTRLDTLVLNNNKIAKLEGESFENVTTLRNLDVSFNKISFIQPGTFKGNTLLHSLNISHNELTTIGYGIFKGLIYLHTLDMSFNEISSLESERFYQVTTLSVLIADHNRITTVNAEDFSGTSLSSLSIGENPIPCEIFVNLKKRNLPFEITAIKLHDKTDDENIDGVTCNIKRGFDTSSVSTSVNTEVSNNILIDIRDILLKNNKFIEQKNNDITVPVNTEPKYAEEISSQIFNMTNRIEKSLANSTKRIESNILNITSKVVHEINITNTLLAKISKVLASNWRTIYTPVQENKSDSLLPYIEVVKMDLENSMAAEKERVNELKEKIAVINTRIDSLGTLDAAKHEKYVANDGQTPTESLFTKTCLALILSILLCIILYKFYKSRMLIRKRLSISTRELPGAMEHSAL